MRDSAPGGVLLKTLLYGGALALVVAPFALGLVPPLIDYPNHLAKVHLAATLPDNAQLAQFYEWRLRFVPNLAQDLIVPPLARALGAYQALRLFLVWSLVQLILGVCLLRYAVHGRAGYWPLASVLFLFNKVVWWGFLNFLFTSGLVLILFAAWILMARRGPVLRVAVFAALMPVMFFLHLIATAILALCIGAYQLGRMWAALAPDFKDRTQQRFCLHEALVALIPFLSLPVLWAFSPTGHNEHLYIHKGLVNFAAAVFSPFSMTGTTWDFSFGLAVLLFIAAALASRQIAIAKPLRLPLLFLLLVASFMPLMVLGVFGTHFRIPFLAGCIAVAAVEPRRPKTLFVMVAVLVIGALFALRGYGLVTEWRRFDGRLAQYRAAIAKIAPGSKVMTVVDEPGDVPWEGAVGPQVFWHLSALVVLDASAFDPLVFSNPNRQSISVRPDKRYLDVTLGQPVPTDWATRAYRFATASAEASGAKPPEPWPGRDWSHWYRDYDYLIRFSYKSPRDDLAGPLKPLASGDWFDLYRIEAAAGGKAP